MSDKLRAWIAQEVKRRGWSYRELARHAGISQPLVSRTLSGDMPASADFCLKIAQALDMPPEHVLRLGGILPPSAPEDDPIIGESLDLLRNMSPSQRQEAWRYLRYLYQRGPEED